MRTLRRAGRTAAWALGGAAYVWFAAVREAPRVRARKEARRQARRAARKTA